MRKSAMVLLVFGMVFGVSVFAGAHGSVDGFFTLPQKVDSNTLKIDAGNSAGGNQHNKVVMKVIFLRRISGTFKVIQTESFTRFDSTGFTETSFLNCGGTAQGSGVFKSRWETSWYNNAGTREHHKGPTTSSNSTTISGTTCFDDS